MDHSIRETQLEPRISNTLSNNTESNTARGIEGTGCCVNTFCDLSVLYIKLYYQFYIYFICIITTLLNTGDIYNQYCAIITW